MYTTFNRPRQLGIFLASISILFILLLRLFNLQILRYKHLIGIADSQHKEMVTLPPRRGVICDRNANPLALNVDVDSMFAVPRKITDKGHTADILADALGLEREEVMEKLARDKGFVWIKRRLDKDKSEKIRKLGLDYIDFIEETKRFYPGSSMACHILGFVDVDNNGIEGLELYYDKYMKGRQGWKVAMLDAKRRDVAAFESGGVAAVDGYNLILTVDEVIQHIVEKEIEDLVRTSRPIGCTVIVLNPRTGEVLASANFPKFDLNYFQDAGREAMRDRGIADSFEPGSVFKIVTASAALEEGLVNFSKEFYCEKGSYRAFGRVLHDYKPYATLTFREVVEKSSNIGVVKVAELLGRDKLYEYIKRFGFGMPAGIDLPGEAGGINRHPSTWSRVDITTVPIGHGISVTAIQLVNAISAIANDGVLMRPYIVSKIVDERNNVIREYKPREIGKVISRETAFRMKDLLYGVVERGTGQKAKLDGFTAAGKTGTAQKPNSRGGYWPDKYVASFIGFAPVENPRIAMVISIDEPKGLHFGGQIAAPVFKKIAEKVLKYLEAQASG